MRLPLIYVNYPTGTPDSIIAEYSAAMHNRGWVIAAFVTCLSCFSTARYDRAHSQRVASIDARYAVLLEREREQYRALVAEIDRRRALVVAVKPGADHAPVFRVDERPEIARCREFCQRSECLRNVCQLSYVDALLKTYYHADFAWVTSQVATSSRSDLESLLAFSHNQSLIAEIDQQAAILEQRHAQTRAHLDQQHQRELRASVQLRDAEIAAGRAARRERVKAAADAFSAQDHASAPSAPSSDALAPPSSQAEPWPRWPVSRSRASNGGRRPWL